MITTELREYLEKHSNPLAQEYPPSMLSWEVTHEKLLKDIAERLREILKSDPVKVYSKVDLFEGDPKIGSVDLVVLTLDEICIIQAMAVNQNRAHTRGNDLNRMRNKLREGYEFFKRFDVAPRMIGVYRRPGVSHIQREEVQRPIEDIVTYTK